MKCEQLELSLHAKFYSYLLTLFRNHYAHHFHHYHHHHHNHHSRHFSHSHFYSHAVIMIDRCDPQASSVGRKQNIFLLETEEEAARVRHCQLLEAPC